MVVRFLSELKRRRVLHTASLYVVGAWIALQVVEVLSSAGLPPSTMRNLLVVLSVGFPIAVVIGWFFDISKQGVSRTGSLKEGERLPDLQFFDHVLLLGLLVVVAVDIYILSFPPPEDIPVVSDTTQQRAIAVLGFEDLQADGQEEGIGETFAGELRSSLTRVAGLRVFGPETSKALGLAGEGRLAMAEEMQVSALLLGKVLLDGGTLQISARLLGVPAGNELWSADVEAAVSDAVQAQNGLIRQVIGAIAPGLDPDPLHGPRAEAGACTGVYDLYLRGKQLSKARKQSQAARFNRGMELLREVVDKDPRCALAWEAIATAEVDWTMPGFVKAGAAARRALEINDALPEAWAVLAEIAEEEERWSESEEYFLRALYADPTNARTNIMYSEALIVRGRMREAIRYALEAYRYEPASSLINYKTSMHALYAGESDLAIKHAGIAGDIDGGMHPWFIGTVAEAYLQKGDVDRALENYAQVVEHNAPWFPDCVRVRQQPELAPGVLSELRKTLEQYTSKQPNARQAFNWGFSIIRCSIWLGEPDIVFEVLDAKGIAPYEAGVPTEARFINMFHPDGAVVRQHPRFRDMVVESGLLEYWKKWGWSDYCRPDGDSFTCD